MTVAGIRTPFIDDLVENVLLSYGMGRTVRSIWEELQADSININENTLRSWIKKAKENGYYKGFLDKYGEDSLSH